MELVDKIGVIYWSYKESTEIMAEKISNGIDEAGAKVILVNVVDFDINTIDSYYKIALGCPAMEGEALEKSEFEPFFKAISGHLNGKKVALFGSHGWGDGEWMRQWQDRVTGDGATLVNGEGLIVNETPDDDALASCKALGEALAK
mgnify:CR=1 FL=1